ncbi:MAG: alpha-hydroxy-acid oxidizing protein [Anaerolineae bacterium]|nr:alpha-hydroxy-acid oxidizing protein [Anaerolineae bacterium]
MNIDQKYPSVAEMEAAAYRRLPPFMRDYLFGALGGNVSRQKNRDDLNAVELMPRYLSDGTAPDIRATLFGRAYDAPFGVAPVGLSGLIWPRAERILAAAAKRHNIPYALSTVATASLEDIRAIAGEHAWYQLYTPKQPEVVKHLLGRCEAVGYDTLLLTVDVPYETRREQDIRSGLTVPPAFNARTVWQMVTHPEWAFACWPRVFQVCQYQAVARDGLARKTSPSPSRPPPSLCVGAWAGIFCRSALP